MKGFLKNRPVFILSVISASLLILNIGSCINLYSQGSGRRKEMAKRLEAEEKAMKLSADNTALIGKLKEQEKEAQQDKSALEASKKVLLQEQLVCQSLKEDLQKVTKLKEALEEDLKKALKNSKKAKR